MKSAKSILVYWAWYFDIPIKVGDLGIDKSSEEHMNAAK